MTRSFSSTLAPLSQEEWKRYSELISELRKIKREDLLVPVLRLQLHYLVNLLVTNKNSAANNLRETAIKARGAAYNIASFTWPGWGDMGTIPKQSQELGLAAAKTALELEEKYDKPSMEVLWMNGAHELNIQNFERAQEFFSSAEDAVDTEELKAMPHTWVVLSDYLNPKVETSKDRLSLALQELRKKDENNGDFFAEQIETVLNIYSEP